MLADRPIHPALPVADLERARRFYAEKLGLTPKSEGLGGLFYRCGENTQFLLYPSQGTAWKIWSNFGAEAVYNETGDTPMNDFEEETVTALRNLFDKVNTLRQIAIRDTLKSETYQLYEENLQVAYDALTTVEDALALSLRSV